MKKKILLVDDEPDILELLKYNLENAGYKVYIANEGESAIELVKKIDFDLIVLDVMMPKMDGVEVCNIIRKELAIEQPIITFLTSRSEDYSQIAGFEAGADDYITKPIRPRVLLSKIESLLRRKTDFSKNNIESIVEETSIFLDRNRFLLIMDEKKIQLPKKEFELLELLIKKPGRVFTRDEILANVWGNDTIVGERTIDVHIRKLREKIGDDYIRTVKGVGYTFNDG